MTLKVLNCIKKISKMNNVIKIFLLVLLSIVFFGCKKENMFDCFMKAGSNTTETRNVEYFDKIYLYDNVNLIITQDTINEIQVDGGKNLLKNIKTTVKNNVLEIRNNNKCNWARSYKSKINVNIKIKALSYIEYWGSGNISTTNAITVPHFRIDSHDGSGTITLNMNNLKTELVIHTGPADFVVSGITDQNYTYSTGNGVIDCRNLISNYCYAVNESTTDFYINPKNHIDAEIKYLGNVYYMGNPPIKNERIHNNAKGRLLKF